MESMLNLARGERENKTKFERGDDADRCPECDNAVPDKEPVDILKDPAFDCALFAAAPKREFQALPEPEDMGDAGPTGLCPYYPRACDLVGTSRCTKECSNSPESYMSPEIKKVFDEEPWSNYCFTCGEFTPSRHHENSLDPSEVVYSHVVAAGFSEYKTKLARWTLERMTGKDAA